MAIKPIANETILLTEVANGGQMAFKRLFYAYHSQLGEFVYSITGSNEITQEIIHDVFLKVWTKREELDQIQNFTSYLFILTRNYTLNCVRKIASQNRREQAYAMEAGIMNSFSEQECEQEKPDYQLLVENAIRQLPPQQQRVLILRQKGLKNTEIARMMGIAPGSVKKYQQWALKSISEFLKSDAAFSFLILFFLRR